MRFLAVTKAVVNLPLVIDQKLRAAANFALLTDQGDRTLAEPLPEGPPGGLRKMLQRLPRLHRAFAPVHCWWLTQRRATAAAGAAAAAAGAAAATATAVVALASQSGGGTAAGCAARVQCPEPLVGVWSQDMAACESMGPFLQGLGVPWFVWPIVDQLHTALHISAPAPGALQIVDQTLFGANTTRVELDRKSVV